nr:TetR/AcrR family transcriptional regulator [Pseudonocardia sp. C8]
MLLATAERLFYEHGIGAVGMDRVRAASGLPLKRIYRSVPGKEALVAAVLRRRDVRWRGDLAAAVERVADPRERVLAVFDWLARWFAEPGFRGCAWINAFGELGPSSEAVRAEVRAHKHAFAEQLRGWVRAAGSTCVEPVFLLAEGAMVTAAVTGSPEPARQAREAVAVLLDRG